MKSPIGLFDSGIGGLSQLAALAAALPGRDFVYLADNASVPFGNRPPEEILALAERGTAFLAAKSVSSALLACNTVTGTCAAQLRGRYPFPIFGVEPAVRPAAARFSGVVGVLATRATLACPKFLALVDSLGAERFLFLPQPRLADRIERGYPNDLAAVVAEELAALSPGASGLSVRPASLVLGCTHYILVRAAIERFTGLPAVDGTAGTVRHILTRESPGDGPTRIFLYVTRPGSLPRYLEVLEALRLSDRLAGGYEVRL